MGICYYCDSENAKFVRHGKAACQSCLEEDIRTIVNPAITMSEEDKAKRLRIMIGMFNDLYGRRK